MFLSLQTSIIMQQFIKYAKQPSNKSDFFQVFQSLANFRLSKPTQVQKKAFFDQQYQSKIMTLYYKHLELNKKLPGSSQEQIASKINRNDFQHVDFIDQFFNWLSKDDTFFVIPDKPQKQVSSKPPAYSYGQKNNYQYPPLTPQYEQEKKVTQAPFTFKKVGGYNTNNQQMPTPPPTPQNYPRPLPPGQIVHAPLESFPLQSNPISQDKPIRTQFLQKFADCFQYPQRWSTMKQELNMLAQRCKRI